MFVPTHSKVLTVYENLFTTAAALWKVKEMYESLGVTFGGSIDDKSFIGKRGKVYMRRKKGSAFLTIDKWIPLEDGDDARNKQVSFDLPEEKKGPTAPHLQDDDVPF